jgi:hypothetical protein
MLTAYKNNSPMNDRLLQTLNDKKESLKNEYHINQQHLEQLLKK